MEISSRIAALSGVVDATNLSDPQSDFGSFSAALPGWLIVSDEQRRFRREVIARLGQDRLVTTAGLLVLAIQSNIIFVKKADQTKKILEQHRFRMAFDPFQGVI